MSNYTDIYAEVTRCIGEDAKRDIFMTMSSPKNEIFLLTPEQPPVDEDDDEAQSEWIEAIEQYPSEEWGGDACIPFKVVRDGIFDYDNSPSLVVHLYNNENGELYEVRFNELSYYMWCIIADMINDRFQETLTCSSHN